MKTSQSASFVWGICCLLLFASTAVSAESAGPSPLQPFTSIAELCRAASQEDRLHWKVKLEGAVRWSNTNSDLFILEDRSGSVPVSTAFAGAPLRTGDVIRLEGDCTLRRDGLATVLCPAVTVDNNGLHAPLEKSGSIYLKAGFQPIRLLWFNSMGGGVLRLSYQGPSLPRQLIPSSALMHEVSSGPGATNNYAPGLSYQCFFGEWDFLPSFRRIPVASTGIVPNFDVSVRPRRESVGMEFRGLLHLPQEGLYTFYLESDDGSTFAVGPSSAMLTVLGSTNLANPPVVTSGRDFSQEQEFRIHSLEGEVVFVDPRELSLRLHLRGREDATLVDIVRWQGDHWRILQGSRIRVTGICHRTITPEGRKVAGYLWAPTRESVQLLQVAADRWDHIAVVDASSLLDAKTPLPPLVRLRGTVSAVLPGAGFLLSDGKVEVKARGDGETPEAGSAVEAIGIPRLAEGRLQLEGACTRPEPVPEGAPVGKLPLLTTIAQVRALGPKKAVLSYPVRVQGVVTARFANGQNFVIQNAEHGVYVNMAVGDTRGPLEIGDFCEVIGITRQATWAPAIAAQRVQRLGLGSMPDPLKPSRDQILNGSLDSQYIEVQGIVTEVDQTGVKLLTRVGRIDIDLAGKKVEEWQQLLDHLVRIKGCVLAVYDRDSGLAISGKLRFVHPAITVDAFPAADPFDAPARRIPSLRAFDLEAGAFQRVRVSGQVTHSHGEFFCLMEENNGMRFFPRDRTPIPVGTLVDVVGFLDLSGQFPTLHEALTRQTGVAHVPRPVILKGPDILSRAYDAALVQVDALLLNSSRDSAQQWLELRAGNHVFRAYLSTTLGALKPISPGSRLRLTGVYLGKGGDWSSGQEISSFDMALNSPSAVSVLQQPSWWTPNRLLALAGSLGVILLLALVWIQVLHRQVEERTRQLTEQIRARQAVEQQRAVEQERTRLARDLHDDLGGGLTEISMLGFLATDVALPGEKKTDYLKQMTEKARELVTALDEIVWAVNPRYDSLASLAAYCSLYAQRFLSLASLKCQLEISDSLPNQALDSNSRHCLFLAFKEALSNVVRHSGASVVTLQIGIRDGELLLTVSDNGRGLSMAQASADGMEGLANMKARLSNLGGRCDIDSGPSQGTTVRFCVPIGLKTHDKGSHR